MYDNGMIRLELVNDWVDKVEGEDGELVYFLQEFQCVLFQCNEFGSVNEEDVRFLCMNVICVYQWCK